MGKRNHSSPSKKMSVLHSSDCAIKKRGMSASCCDISESDTEKGFLFLSWEDFVSYRDQEQDSHHPNILEKERRVFISTQINMCPTYRTIKSVREKGFLILSHAIMSLLSACVKYPVKCLVVLLSLLVLFSHSDLSRVVSHGRMSEWFILNISLPCCFSIGVKVPKRIASVRDHEKEEKERCEWPLCV